MVVNAIQELGAHILFEQVQHFDAGCFDDFSAVLFTHFCEVFKIFQDDIRAHVGGHDDDGVFEVGDAALVIGEAAIVEYLE